MANILFSAAVYYRIGRLYSNRPGGGCSGGEMKEEAGALVCSGAVVAEWCAAQRCTVQDKVVVGEAEKVRKTSEGQDQSTEMEPLPSLAGYRLAPEQPWESLRVHFYRN